MMQTPFHILQRVGREASTPGYLFIVLGVRKELKQNSSMVNQLLWHRQYPMSGWWKEVQRSSTQYGWSRRLSNIPIHAWDRSRQRPARRCGRGTQTEVALGQRSEERVCVNVDEIDHIRCEYKSKGIYMPNKCKKRNRFMDSGPEVCVRCSKPKRQLCAKNTK